MCWHKGQEYEISGLREASEFLVVAMSPLFEGHTRYVQGLIPVDMGIEVAQEEYFVMGGALVINFREKSKVGARR